LTNPDLDSVLGTREKLPSINNLLNKVGDKVIAQIISDPKVMQVKEFVGGRPGEPLFFQGKRVVNQSGLNLQLPYDPVVQVVFDVQLKSGERRTAWMAKELLKALRASTRTDGSPSKGGMIAIELTELKENGTANPKKFFKVQVKQPKE